MNTKCKICKERIAELAWQPYGPDESPHYTIRIGYHFRGFTMIPICGECEDLMKCMWDEDLPRLIEAAT